MIDCDSFNGYGFSDLALKFTGASNRFTFNETQNGVDISTTRPRTNTTSLYVGGFGGYATKVLNTNITTGTVGFALSCTTPTEGASIICSLLDGGTNQIELRKDASGLFYLTRNGTTIVAAAGTLNNSTNYDYLELSFVIDGTTGSATLKKNNVQVWTATGLNTKNSSNSYINQVRFQSDQSSSVHFFADYYINNTGVFYGPIKILYRPQTGDGLNIGFTPSTGTTHYTMINDATPNTTNYNSALTTGLIDTFTHGAFSPATGSILAVKTSIYCQDAASVLSVAPVLLSNGVTTVGTTVIAPPSYGYKEQIFETDAGHSNAAWTDTFVNALETGYKSL